MFKSALVALASVSAIADFAAPVHAQSVSIATDPGFIRVSGGCGPNGWRGTWGHCHYARYRGPVWAAPYGPIRMNGCPPGYWRGPWGHCRNTPFHGRLPGGDWR